MKVYPVEVTDGLAGLLGNPGRTVLASLVTKEASLPHCLVEGGAGSIGVAVGTNEGQIDLYYLRSLLVSTGLNKNFHFFEKGQVWAARKTPEDKPFNFEHEQTDILGHITSCWAVGADGVSLADDIKEVDLPDAYSIMTSAVIYRAFKDQAHAERVQTLIGEIEQGKWYVSMEVLFASFDYLLVPMVKGEPDMAQAQIVERNDETAFLTKHLKTYGGKGFYKNYLVGHVLRQLTFSGKGLVENPANPTSVIFPVSSGSAPKITQVPAAAGYEPVDHTSEETMAIENEDKKTVSELTAKIEKLEAALASVKEKGYEEKITILQADLKTGEAKLAEAKTLLTASAEAANAALAASAEWKTNHDVIAAQLVVANAELTKVTEAKRQSDRVVAIKSAYQTETDEEAIAVATTLAPLGDEAFAAAINVQSELLKKKLAAAAVTVKVGESKVSDKPAPMAGGSKKIDTIPEGAKAPPVAPTVVTAADVAGATIVAEPALAVAAVETAVASLQDEIAAFLAPTEKATKGRGRGRKQTQETE